MSVEVTCKKCGNRLRAGDKYAGWRVQCPQCSAMNQFPAMGEPLPDSNDAPPPAPSSETPVQAKPLPVPSQTPTGARSAPAANQNPTPTGARRCTLCDRPISANDMAQDTEGKVYHRRCYDRERARRLAATVRQQGTPNRPATNASPQRGTPERPPQAKPASPPAWVPPTISKSSKPSAPATPPDEIPEGGPPTPSPSATPSDEVLADSSLLVPLPDPADSVVPTDDLWADPSLPSVAADAFGPAPIYEPPVRMSQGMYTLIGIGAAMPVLAILAMLVYSLTRSTSAPPLPPSSAAQSVTPSAPGVAPGGSPATPNAPNPAVAAPAVASNLPVWQPDPALLDQLAAYLDLGAYQIRLPKGYESIQAPAVPIPGTSMYAWAGTPRPDGTRPSVLVMVAQSPSPQDAASTTVLQFHEKVLESLKQRRSDWQQTPVESGLVNGLPFARAAWQATAPELARKMCGIEYATKDGATFIQLRSQDIDSYQEQTLKLGSAAILTFRKK